MTMAEHIQRLLRHQVMSAKQLSTAIAVTSVAAAIPAAILVEPLLMAAAASAASLAAAWRVRETHQNRAERRRGFDRRKPAENTCAVR